MSFKSTILIVDDEEIGREVLEDLLITQGYKLVFAQNGPEALEQAAKFTPDLILLDIMMPRMDGFEVCRRLRANPTLAEVPIVMITALYDQDSRLQGIEAGADDFISKPFARVELRARIKTITRLNRYRRLLAERNKFEWAVNKANEGYVILDNNDQILYINSQACTWLGLAVDTKEPPTKPFLSLVQEQYQCKPQEMWSTWPPSPATFTTNNNPYYLIYPETTKSKPLWLQLDLLPMESGSNEQYIIRLYDITDSMAKQSLMWSFQAQISHKLRTPSNIITGYLGLAEQSLSTLSKEDLQLYISTSLKSAMRLQDQIQTILQYIELPDLINPKGGTCYIGEITVLISQIKTDLNLNPVSISYTNLKDPDDIQIALACQAVELILLELFKNAQKFHPKQTPTITINFSNHPNGIQIQFADDGRSLSPEELTKIWTPYYQAEKNLTGEVPGMGLGLTMVRTWIWRVGGTCQVYNQKNHPGLVVELVLPIINPNLETNF